VPLRLNKGFCPRARASAGRPSRCVPKTPVETAMRAASITGEPSDYLMSHCGGGMGREYGEQNLPALARAVTKIKFGAV